MFSTASATIFRARAMVRENRIWPALMVKGYRAFLYETRYQPDQTGRQDRIYTWIPSGSVLTEREVTQNTASARPICTNCSLMEKSMAASRSRLFIQRLSSFKKFCATSLMMKLSLSCFPFDVTEPQGSVEEILDHLQNKPMKVIQ